MTNLTMEVYLTNLEDPFDIIINIHSDQFTNSINIGESKYVGTNDYQRFNNSLENLIDDRICFSLDGEVFIETNHQQNSINISLGSCENHAFSVYKLNLLENKQKLTQLIGNINDIIQQRAQMNITVGL